MFVIIMIIVDPLLLFYLYQIQRTVFWILFCIAIKLQGKRVQDELNRTGTIAERSWEHLYFCAHNSENGIEEGLSERRSLTTQKTNFCTSKHTETKTEFKGAVGERGKKDYLLHSLGGTKPLNMKCADRIKEGFSFQEVSRHLQSRVLIVGEDTRVKQIFTIVRQKDGQYSV